MVAILQLWVLLVVGVAIVYTFRNWMLTLHRLFRPQRLYYQDILDSDLPAISILIPMHNEEVVAAQILDTLLRSDYPRNRLEIIPINDHSSDQTAKILDGYACRFEFIQPLHRHTGQRGKPSGLNEALARAAHEVVLVFDADYQPSRGLLRSLAVAFLDPEVGAVMGRVIPKNVSAGILTRLLDFERSAGYQIDQQARYSLDLIPQYGGTVGGFRKSVIQKLGGFDPRMLAEDTHLTFQLYLAGWRVAYANRAECYEEVPETWEVRYRQLRRWARGHNQVFFRYAWPLVTSSNLTLWQKTDGLLVLAMYALPVLMLSGFLANLVLFLLGAKPVAAWMVLILLVVQYNSCGNFAPFFQAGAAGVLDGMTNRLRMLPFLFILFIFNTWVVLCGFWDAILDLASRRTPVWDKTARFQKNEELKR